MGFKIKKVFKAAAAPAKKAVTASVKDAVPLAAAYITGGASLAVLKPQGSLMGLSKFIGNGPQKSIEEVATQYVEEKANAELDRVVSRAMNPKIKTPSKRINSQSVSVPQTSMDQKISESFESVTSSVGGKSNFFMIAGGMLAVIALIFILRGKK